MTETRTPEDDRVEDDMMVSAVSELLVSTRSYQNRPDRLYANELAGQIIDAMSEAAKVRAAEVLSRLSNPPEELLRDLVASSTEAARKILTARNVTDAVLMESASKSVELREIIARRPQLSEPVVNKLLFHEESSVETILLTRPEIQISNSRAARLISRVDEESSLGWMLAKRTDIVPRLCLRLFWNVDTQSRTAILKRVNADPRFAAEIFNRMLEKGAHRASRSAVGGLATLIARILQSEEHPDRTFVATKDLQLFRSKPESTVVQRVAAQASISGTLARKIAADYRGESFAILCRATGISEKAFSKLSAVKPTKPSGTAPFSNEDREQIKKVFTSTLPSSAVAILSYWEIDIAVEEKTELRRQLATDLNEMQKRLTTEFGEERVDLPEAPAEEPKKKRRWL